MKISKILILSAAALSLAACGGGNNSDNPDPVNPDPVNPDPEPHTDPEPFQDVIEWKEDDHLKVPNGKTWERKRQLTGGTAYYMRRSSGSDSCYILAQYPDGTYIDGYDDSMNGGKGYRVTAMMTTSWQFTIAKTSWIKFTITNDNAMSGQTDLYWYSY
ncbi:MAG: hypothetical protein MJ221_01465 [Bacilli bacterium]|nr:hypothetical protein [Bacilli bacterium]